MMLAPTGYLEILTESFRRQRLDDPTLKGEYCGKIRSAVELQPYRLSTCKTIFYNSKEITTKGEANNSSNMENNKPKISTMSPLQLNEKDLVVQRKKTEKFNASERAINSSSQEGKSRLDDKTEIFPEILSSSEEELRDLNKTFLALKEVPRGIPQDNPAEIPRWIKNGNNFDVENQIVNIDKDVCKRRYKPNRPNFKKKIKLSRPSLNLHKMLATRFSNKDLTTVESFCPIEKLDC